MRIKDITPAILVKDNIVVQTGTRLMWVNDRSSVQYRICMYIRKTKNETLRDDIAYTKNVYQFCLIDADNAVKSIFTLTKAQIHNNIHPLPTITKQQEALYLENAMELYLILFGTHDRTEQYIIDYRINHIVKYLDNFYEDAHRHFVMNYERIPGEG